jgi:predicted nucleic acid-binding protein
MTLVDTNVLLDIATNDSKWAAWSMRRLDAAAIRGPVLINAVVYAEFSIGYARIEEVDRVLADVDLKLAETPRAALFLAGKAFQRYRARGGARTSVLPDFFIGAHAAVARLSLLTRDPGPYRTYFPGVELIAPEETER